MQCDCILHVILSFYYELKEIGFVGSRLSFAHIQNVGSIALSFGMAIFSSLVPGILTVSSRIWLAVSYINLQIPDSMF